MLFKGAAGWQGKRHAHACRLAKQDAKAFLGEMVIVRQDVREALAAHDVHGDTIREAVLRIETRFVERQAVQKQRLGGWQNLDAGVLENLTGFGRRALAGDLPCRTLEREKLRQHPLGGHERAGPQGPAERHDPSVPGVMPMQ